MAESSPATLSVTDDPAPTEQQQVIALVARAAAQDGHPAVNEAGLLALRRTDRDTDPAPTHVLAHDPDTGDLVGYAQAIGQESGPVAALVVAPDRRRRGIGSALWRRLATETSGPLRVWASGDSPAARALAASEGLQPIRTLRVLARSLGGDLPSAAPPAGISLRTFRPGLDEEEWLAVNARAFALHPEQGSLTRADLEQRKAEAWFDPAGFFLAWREEPAGPRLLGSHWTKVHPAGEAGDAPVGEVYVLGIDPDAQGTGLGRALTDLGLAHLRARGLSHVLLYVEEDNTAAVALYERSGFTRFMVDVSWRRPTPR